MTRWVLRTEKVTLRWIVARPNAQRRKPQGKVGGSWDMAWKSGRACLGGRKRACLGAGRRGLI